LNKNKLDKHNPERLQTLQKMGLTWEETKAAAVEKKDGNNAKWTKPP